eukprot:UN3460
MLNHNSRGPDDGQCSVTLAPGPRNAACSDEHDALEHAARLHQNLLDSQLLRHLVSEPFEHLCQLRSVRRVQATVIVHQREQRLLKQLMLQVVPLGKDLEEPAKDGETELLAEVAQRLGQCVPLQQLINDCEPNLF